ncbi:hypothetical protein CMV_025818 [Castanea mollissima]|uniref:Disease resistance RPP13-like protein 1 n=1 Tax=Castanea mollissima TaxID=60419 RepID=A0A8J4QKY6_9ROSI|nr:hypothetical protein CMV_025818 [Castanea mollissima]
MSFIGEAALSAVIDALFGKLGDDLLKTFRKENFDADLKKWKRMLLKIRAVLDDAEQKQVTSPSVKFWLAELEDLAYDVDDVLDEFATEALRRELNPETKSKIRKVLGDNVGSNRDFVKLMRGKIEGINGRLQEIVEEKKDLELRENTGGRTVTTTSRPPSTSLVNESRTYGRDEDKKEIVKLLLESSDAQLSVIPIVDSLQGKLKNTLSGKKFLLILDDVWNENYDLWTELCKPFEFGAQGSKIVVTTRNDGVSSMMGINSPYKLEGLSRDACLRVFTHHALVATDFNAHSIREMPAGIAKLKSLRTLCFKDMDEWQDWIPCRVEGEEFPCLCELSIFNCPKLRNFSYHLPSLEKLSIYACKQLVVSIPSHSVIQVLEIVRCKEVVHGSLKVEKLIIRNCKKLTSLCEDELMSFVTLEIEINSCQSLVNIKLKSTLRTLTIKGCNALESMQFVMDEGGASSTSSLLMNEENLSCIGNNNASLLEHLEILGCTSLKCVSTIVDQSAMLKRLDIKFCPNLTSLSSKHILPTTLKVLHVMVCPELELIVDELHKDTLLEELKIWNCEKLRRLPRGLHELCHLKKFYLEERDSLISNCPSLKHISFPEEGFHTNLRELGVAGANLCKQIFELGLHRLTSLTSLSIAYGIMDSFPEEEDGKTMLMLPTSLTSLTFYKFPNLLFLSWKFFQNLSALEQIYITMCPKLASLSEKCFPPSLQRLEILCCPGAAEIILQNRELFLPVEASFKTWRRLHIMLRNNDQWICTVAGWLFNMMPEQHVILTKDHALHR